MDHQADMQPSTSYVATNDDTVTDCLADDLEVDDRSRELKLKKIDVLKRKLQKLQNRSVDWENEDHEDRCFAEEESIQKQLNNLLKELDVDNNISMLVGAKDLSGLLVVKGTGSELLDEKITAMLRIIFESSNAGGRLERFIDRRELVQLCKSCRSEEAGTAIPKDPRAFEDFVCKTAKTINNISVKYRSAFYEDVWDDYLEDDEKAVLEAAVIAPEMTENKPNIDAALEEFARQAENSEDEGEGDDCSDGPSEESPEEDNTEEAESSDPAAAEQTDNEEIVVPCSAVTKDEQATVHDVSVPNNVNTTVPYASVTQDKSDVTVSKDEKNADPVEAVPKDEVAVVESDTHADDMGDPQTDYSFCEILDEVNIRVNIANGDNSEREVLSVSTDMPANSGDDDDIKVVYEKEVTFVEPINTQKDAYVWSWLQNKCSSNPDIPDDEPVLKRARYDDDEINDGEQATSPTIIVIDD